MKRAIAMAWRAALPWAVLAAALGAATSPLWRILTFGFHSTLEELLSIRCFGP